VPHPRTRLHSVSRKRPQTINPNAAFGDRPGIGLGKLGSRELRASVVRRTGSGASVIRHGRSASAEKHRLASSLRGATEPAASPLVRKMGRLLSGDRPQRNCGQCEWKNGKALGSGRQ
jgi:hypothetical protein